MDRARFQQSILSFAPIRGRRWNKLPCTTGPMAGGIRALEAIYERHRRDALSANDALPMASLPAKLAQGKSSHYRPGYILGSNRLQRNRIRGAPYSDWQRDQRVASGQRGVLWP